MVPASRRRLLHLSARKTRRQDADATDELHQPNPLEGLYGTEQKTQWAQRKPELPRFSLCPFASLCAL